MNTPATAPAGGRDHGGLGGTQPPVVLGRDDATDAELGDTDDALDDDERAPGGLLPFHADLYSISQLEQHARHLAVWHEPTTGRGRYPDELLPRLASTDKRFKRAYALLTAAVGRGRRITPAAEWFIDNMPLIDEQIRTARRHLPRGYSRELPRLVNSACVGTPRVYNLALELVSHSHGRVDEEGLRAFINAYQRIVPLRLGELWAIPIMLRLALLENLRRVVANITAGRRERELAGVWIARMLEAATARKRDIVLVLAEMLRATPVLTDSFVAELASRLQGQGPALAVANAWLEQRLADHGQSVAHVFQVASQTQAADQVAIGNSIGSLRFLGATDWQVFVEGTSVVEATLRADPAGVYPRMDFETRDRYRHAVETLARHSASTENEVARAAIELAAEAARNTHRNVGTDVSAHGAEDLSSHVGMYLVDEGLELLERKVSARIPWRARVRRLGVGVTFALYVGAIALLTAALVAPVAVGRTPPTVDLDAPQHLLLTVLLLGLLVVCVSQLAVAVVDWLSTLLVPPRVLARMDFRDGIPLEHATLVAVPALLSDETEVAELCDALELRFLSNRTPHLAFALVSDFKDAATETTAQDDALLASARDRIMALNIRYGFAGDAGPFFLLHRPRRFNARDGVWMGWERKRGKLEDLNDTLRGAQGRFTSVVGDLAALQGSKYVIALDSDTQLPRDAARLLAGTAAHPLNRPVYDEARRRVTRGYSFLQPRISVSMESTARTRFAQIFAGEPGIDPYTRAVSDVYQDLFDEGSFIGKGIYDVDAVRRALCGRFPDNRVLSHDLLEGAHGRCALVTDVLLVEDFPAAHAADVARRARWVRGDWQIASWIGPRVPGGVATGAAGVETRAGGHCGNALSALSRWKIFDNLRRSMVPPALLALLLVSWHLPTAAWLAPLLVVVVLVLPGLLNAGSALVRSSPELSRRRRAPAIVRDLGKEFLRGGLALAWLPFDAFLNLRSIAVALGRVIFTRRRLLEWRTASDASRAAHTTLAGAYVSLWTSPTTALIAVITLAIVHPPGLAIAAPFLLLWGLSPALSWVLSAPRETAPTTLTADDQRFLRRIARRTWRYFEVFVAEADNHLPPDNFQEHPPTGIAHRTSPTNIGLALTANLAAWDFGYLTTDGLIERTTATLASLDRLDRHHGHFYNWYDTQTLDPLLPLYVSTVDSGNLVGHMLTLAAGLDEIAAHPTLPPAAFDGLLDVVDLIEEAEEVAPVAQALRTALQARPSGVTERIALFDAVAREATALSQTAQSESELGVWADSLLRQALALQAELTAEQNSGDAIFTERAAALQALAHRCRAFAEVEVDFLYDKSRRLLSIGANIGDHRLDASYYDLLASEARLASYIAVAQGRLPQEHWFSLGRALTTTGGKPSLLSWSGSMFEYLMPLLIMPTYERTLLHETYRGVVDRQIAYGRAHDVPWGVSESGYTKTDAHRNYQYRAFGVPGLGFKRGLAEDLVVAPYASAMALMVAPTAACDNLRELALDGTLGGYGFYEAIDYTTARLPPGKTRVTVRSFMAHHQGMTFLSLAFSLLDRPMQRRFFANPPMRAAELLLQERVPQTAPIYPNPAEMSPLGLAAPDAAATFRVFTTPSTPRPEVHLLSNGSYHVAVTNAGGGYSRWRDLAVTRWREDPTRDCWGTFLFLRDVDSGETWSAAHQPTRKRATRYEAIFSQGRAEFRRVDGHIETYVEMSVSPEDDIELRRVSITNRGTATRTLELTSYAEVVLAPANADASHPAFSNLFVQTELLAAQQAILCTRRPRSGQERPPTLLHLMSVHGGIVGTTSFETARDAFIGRGRSVADPIAMTRAALGNSAGSVLDPIVAIRNTIVIEPHQTVQLHMVTGVSETRERALQWVEKYRDRHSADRVLELAWTQDQVLLRRLDSSDADVQLYEQLAGRVLYANPALRAPEALVAKNRRGQSGLWGYGISGDLPIVLVRIGDIDEIQLVRHMLRAHVYWRLKGLAVDLVIWNEDPSGYRQELQDQIMALIASVGDGSLVDKPGGTFVRRGDQMSEEDKILLQTVARLIVSDTAGSLSEQVQRTAAAEMPANLFPQGDRRTPVPRVPVRAAPAPKRDLAAFNGIGGFTQDGREYVITTTKDAPTPAPWVNVLANPWFGSVVTESGTAYTWCENAHSYRLTPWNNDPVGDTGGEALFLRDDDDGSFWSPTPLPAPSGAPYTTRHGFGYSIFEHTRADITTELTTFVAIDAPVKLLLLKVTNRSTRPRRLSLTAVFELVLGAGRPANLPHIVTELDARSGGLLAGNAYNSEFGERVAFLDTSEARRSVSGDRTEVIGRNNDLTEPACMKRVALSGRVGARLDPCFAMQVAVDLAPGQEREIAFTFGSGRDRADAQHLVGRFRGIAAAHDARAKVWATWNRTLGSVNVQTPDASVNFLANGWLLYQVISSRLWARSGFYQSGGAFGFRDQLQDAMALVHAEPSLLREQLLRCAAHQFREGDVQHWWHPPLGRGVRTRISDDYLWLPYATARYVGALGDSGVLDEVVPFIDGRPVKHDEDSYYDLPARADASGTLYEHCVRALRHGLRFGAHGLPLMGSGDWNDGMNLVGDRGLGESVWLAFFLHDVLMQFEPIARRRGDTAFADLCLAQAATLQQNIETHGWDGAWYRRAYFDDGTPLGSKDSVECQIDALPQSWALLSGVGSRPRALQALASLDERLVKKELGVIQLFDPPFDGAGLEPGYVRGYVPGVRENGGQYTHAAVWAVMAFAAAGDVKRAWELFALINPVKHGDSAAGIARYKVEPYVVAADVYTNPQHAGRGGWTWYTGSAGWMLRLVQESLLGLTLEVDRLRIRPLLPEAWPEVTVHYRWRDTVHHIHIARVAAGSRVLRVIADGVAQDDRKAPLHGDGAEHWIEVEVGGGVEGEGGGG